MEDAVTQICEYFGFGSAACEGRKAAAGKSSVGEFSADKKIHEFRDRKKVHVAGFRIIPGRCKFFRCVGRDYEMFTP